MAPPTNSETGDDNINLAEAIRGCSRRLAGWNWSRTLRRRCGRRQYSGMIRKRVRRRGGGAANRALANRLPMALHWGPGYASI
jgi:hypothetical protein